MRDAICLPAQALFESDGKMFVYLRSGKTFARRDITLIRRNEIRMVLSGLREGQEVALVDSRGRLASSESALVGTYVNYQKAYIDYEKSTETLLNGFGMRVVLPNTR
jgi:hypothetical protein